MSHLRITCPCAVHVAFDFPLYMCNAVVGRCEYYITHPPFNVLIQNFRFRSSSMCHM